MRRIIIVLILVLAGQGISSYPLDGYLYTGIERLRYMEDVLFEIQRGRLPKEGGLWISDSIKLTLLNRGMPMYELPPVDPDLQEQIEELFPRSRDRYSVSILDITPGRPVRYAEQRAEKGYQPGSVGKLIVLAALFCELENIYVDCYDDRWLLLRNKVVRGGPFTVYDEHTVPIYDLEKERFSKRQVRESDEFNLYEWLDHMVSVSNNGAASVVWREAVLMRVFQQDYPELTQAAADAYFKETPRRELMDIAIDVVRCPLEGIGITEEEWRLGKMFTKGATAIVPRKGGSIGSTRGVMKFLLALESGRMIDEKSSLEMKRLMYVTSRRIRYGASRALDSAAVYFKSGSLYGCSAELPGPCGKYKGNRMNYMNSVAIVEQPDGTRYVVVLMTNVLRKNSNWDHRRLAGQIDNLIRPEVPETPVPTEAEAMRDG